MIKELSRNKYRIIVEIGYSIDNKRKRKTEIFYGTKGEAKNREYEIKKQYLRKDFVADSRNMTFEDFSKIFIHNYCEGNVGVKTLDGYKAMIDRINSYIGTWQLSNITTFVLMELYKKLKTGTRKSVLTNNTLLHYYTLLNLMFSQAVKWKLLECNPNEDIPRPKKEKKLAKCYDVEQIGILLNGLKNECLKYQALIWLAIDSGARRSELLALTWEDVDFSTKVMTINKSLDVIKGEIVEKPVKNDTSNRKLVLTNQTIEILKAYKQERIELTENWQENTKLFVANSGKPMYPTTCGKILQKVAVKYGLPKLNFHSLRHSSASLQIVLGIHSKVIQERMGHSSTNVTTGIYSHVFQASRVDVANKLNSVFEGILT